MQQHQPHHQRPDLPLLQMGTVMSSNSADLSNHYRSQYTTSPSQNTLPTPPSSATGTRSTVLVPQQYDMSPSNSVPGPFNASASTGVNLPRQAHRYVPRLNAIRALSHRICSLQISVSPICKRSSRPIEPLPRSPAPPARRADYKFSVSNAIFPNSYRFSVKPAPRRWDFSESLPPARSGTALAESIWAISPDGPTRVSQLDVEYGQPSAAKNTAAASTASTHYRCITARLRSSSGTT